MINMSLEEVFASLLQWILDIGLGIFVVVACVLVLVIEVIKNFIYDSTPHDLGDPSVKFHKVK